ncbi:MAG TPA: serine/threonine-protein kinase [Candidatus Dormibacteraeota bacterium]|nr:serine/threonine-protein kinase [Candidatus Dormibacteraeota bacterium]
MSLCRKQEIFGAAVEIEDEAERNALLEAACAGDAQLRAQVEELLGTTAQADGFFEECATVIAASKEELEPLFSRNGAGRDGQPKEPIGELVGSTIGSYKLLQALGEGGCGAVYLAEQEKPVHRTVALKVIKLGMDTKSVIARFEAEQHALALMDHPGIARVLDAGATDSGRPYFVMELVRGVRITTYCDENKLNVEDRLNLFIQVCQAVQHAHQKGIIHRDIKPSNILVTTHDSIPTPKVIDFGIAKAIEGRLTDQTVLTPYEHFIGTPAYMSPEQAELRGLDVDTRSDIYSLGVLLYELLTGKTPFDQKDLLALGTEEMRRTLREREPLRPSKRFGALPIKDMIEAASRRRDTTPRLESVLRGDLDWIVMKALEKDRGRRYETANGLALDIQRYLHNEPVTARPPSRWYRLRKLVRRNRAVFAAGTGIALALAIGFDVSTWMFFRERSARKEQVRLREVASRALENEGHLRLQAENRERVTQAAFLISRNQLPDADEIVGKASEIQPSLEAENVLRRLGEWHALRSEWDQAAARFEQLLKADQKDDSEMITLDLLMAGPIQIERGDVKAYEHFRRAAIERFKNTSDVTDAERTLKISLLAPGDAEVIRALKPFQAMATESFETDPVNAGTYPLMAAWRCISLALMAYREDYMPTAQEWCRQAASYEVNTPARIATAHIINAMASYQLGEVSEARSEFEAGRKMVESQFSTGLTSGNGQDGFWFDWLFARVLLREARSLMR